MLRLVLFLVLALLKVGPVWVLFMACNLDAGSGLDLESNFWRFLRVGSGVLISCWARFRSCLPVPSIMNEKVCYILGSLMGIQRTSREDGSFYISDGNENATCSVSSREHSYDIQKSVLVASGKINTAHF